MSERQEHRVVIPPARTGRPPARARVHKPNELVRFETRIPAWLAQRIYEAAAETGRPVTAVLTDFLAKAVDDHDGGAMA